MEWEIHDICGVMLVLKIFDFEAFGILDFWIRDTQTNNNNFLRNLG
jgi:hypothetical protein